MNDLEELRFGVLTGVQAARNCNSLRTAFGDARRYQKFLHALDHYFKEFAENHVFDTYVLCASEHDPHNNDGVLSMWRGYGGNGNGVAIVFDTRNLELAPPPTSLVLAKMEYGTVQKRERYLHERCEQTASIVGQNSIPDDQIYLVSYALFHRIKLFALFTKHNGFEEEREWRAVYRHEFDESKRYEGMFGYHLGGKGVEPKLRFKVKPLTGVTAEDLSLEKLIHSIILDPTNSSLLAKKSVARMLASLNRPQLAERVVVSSIPLRPR